MCFAMSESPFRWFPWAYGASSSWDAARSAAMRGISPRLRAARRGSVLRGRDRVAGEALPDRIDPETAHARLELDVHLGAGALPEERPRDRRAVRQDSLAEKVVALAEEDRKSVV